MTIQLGVGPDDDGAFDNFEAKDIHVALCQAFPLCRMSEIAVYDITPAGIVDSGEPTLESALAEIERAPKPSEIVDAIERAFDDGTLQRPKPKEGGDPA